MLDRALEALDTSLDRVPQRARSTRTSPSTATRAWKRCWPTSRSATACRRRSRRCWRAGAGHARRCRRRGARAAAAGQDPDHRQRARRDQLRQLLPARSPATRSWATTPPARASSCTGSTAPTSPSTASRPSAGCRSAGTARCTGDYQAALQDRGRQPARRAGAGRGRDRRGRLQHRLGRIPRARPATSR